MTMTETQTQVRDWADDEARTHVRYLRKCRNEAEEEEYLAVLLRQVEARGALRGGRDLGEALGWKPSIPAKQAR